jgi:hypothetical protein
VARKLSRFISPKYPCISILIVFSRIYSITKRVAVTLPEDARVFLEQEAEETGVPLTNLISYIAVNYVREEKKKRSSQE